MKKNQSTPTSGLQSPQYRLMGCPCKPPSHTPDVKLDPLLPVNSFKWGTWVFLSAFIGHCSFIQGKIQSGED